jgi:hypothetical protein
MIPLTIGVAIFDEHTRLARLETSAPLLAALGAAIDCRHLQLLPHHHSPRLGLPHFIAFGGNDQGSRLWG